MFLASKWSPGLELEPASRERRRSNNGTGPAPQQRQRHPKAQQPTTPKVPNQKKKKKKKKKRPQFGPLTLGKEKEIRAQQQLKRSAKISLKR